MRGSFAELYPFDGARCAHMADRVIAALRGA
jgi:RNA polymerase sigma-70 factor (ECF subfamily)